MIKNICKLLLILSMLMLFGNQAIAEVIIGSEQWGQPQVIEISQTSEGNYLFLFCLDIGKSNCRFLGSESEGYSVTQLDWIRSTLDQRMRSTARNKPLLFAASMIGSILSLKTGIVLGSTGLMVSSELITQLTSDPNWQVDYFRYVKKQLRTKDGEFYVPDVEALAKYFYELLLIVPKYQVRCGCKFGENFSAREDLFIKGLGMPGFWAARMNAEINCRNEALKSIGQFNTAIELTCEDEKSASTFQYNCLPKEFCK